MYFKIDFYMILKEVIDKLNSFSPNSYQESFDNSGLQVGDMSQNINSVLVCLDVTEDVLNEAISRGANLIVSHHPLIFHGLKRVTIDTYIERIIRLAIKNDIAIYSMHTNLDKIRYGVSWRLAEELKLKNISILSKDKENVNIGLGAIGDTDEEYDELEFLQYVKQKLNLQVLKHSPLLHKKVKKVALCGGSGAEFISEAIAQQADIYITADVKYHEYFTVDNQLVIVDVGHYESEIVTKSIIYEQLIGFFPKFAVAIYQTDNNPVCYL